MTRTGRGKEADGREGQRVTTGAKRKAKGKKNRKGEGKGPGKSLKPAHPSHPSPR